MSDSIYRFAPTYRRIEGTPAERAMMRVASVGYAFDLGALAGETCGEPIPGVASIGDALEILISRADARGVTGHVVAMLRHMAQSSAPEIADAIRAAIGGTS